LYWQTFFIYINFYTNVQGKLINFASQFDPETPHLFGGVRSPLLAAVDAESASLSAGSQKIFFQPHQKRLFLRKKNMFDLYN
tara:strand:- start:106 stop:351 length:246 start_codon:yes stop_codon:yes gene_type:complete